MIRFGDRVYTHSAKGLLMWEPSWETFRPLDSVVWNPLTSEIEPFFGLYIHDVFDRSYGYGSPEMHDFCIKFTDDHVHLVEDAPTKHIHELWRWLDRPLVWTGDRAIALHPCSTLDRKQFLSRFNLRQRTFKRSPRNLRGTRKVTTHQ